MQLIRCTGKLRKEMGLKDSELSEDLPKSTGLGPWHANLIYIQRRKCLLFVNDKTLINFLVPDVKRSDIRDLKQVFLGSFHPVLAQEGISDAEREFLACEYDEIGYAKSNSKSVLGSMNDFAFHYEYGILDNGGIHNARIPQLIHYLNNMPMGALDYALPSEALKNHLRRNGS